MNDSIRTTLPTTLPTGKARRTTRWAARLTQLARWALPAALVVATGTAQAVVSSNCWDTTHPDSRYVVNSSAGTVKDNTTNLLWKQCVEGRSGSGCAGGFINMNWDAGNSTARNSTQSGYNDWRMPSLAELQSLLPAACSNPKINTTVFPNTPASWTWTGETVTATPANAWVVTFQVGANQSIDKAVASFVVRLVRGGQSLDPLAPTAQTLAFATPLPRLSIGSSPTLTASSNGGNANSGNAIRYSSTTPTVCAVDAGTGQISLTATAVAGNTCTIAADQYGRINNGVNYAPATQVTQSLSVVAGSLDIDGDSRYNPATDGLLLVRYVKRLTGSALIQGAVARNGSRTTDTAILSYLNTFGMALDVDASGVVDTTDALLITRWMAGLRGASLVAGIPLPAGTTAATFAEAVRNRIEALNP